MLSREASTNVWHGDSVGRGGEFCLDALGGGVGDGRIEGHVIVRLGNVEGDKVQADLAHVGVQAADL